jgi:glycosyltransferase involved in cell wall biosynthesis
MAKVAFPSYDVQTLNSRAGGVGTFISQFARLLKDRGDEVTIILTREEAGWLSIDPNWREAYRSWGIELVEMHNRIIPNKSSPRSRTMQLSEQVAPLLRGFDVVYFSDWANVGFHSVRVKRFTDTAMPVCVTVMHGPSNWVRLCDQKYPELPEDLYIEFIERYAALNSDFVVAPSRFILDWAKGQAWKFRREPEVLGLPYHPESRLPPSVNTASGFTRLAFFGRLQPMKGYQLFVEAIRLLARESPELLQALDEVVLLGHEDVPGAVEWIRFQLARIGLPTSHLGRLDSLAVRDYMARHVSDTLVVIPSMLENFPCAVIEASLIPGLNFIFTSSGGTPEIFAGRGQAQMFAPTARALAGKLRERLTLPLAPDQLVRYDFATANQRWLEFHQRVCADAREPRAASLARPAGDTPSVAVCITYYNKQRHFPQLCESLEYQTSKDFHVIAIDDGSPEAEARAVFEAMAEKYRPRGWTFIRQPNRYVDAARNQAARNASAQYLLMIDADDVLAPNTIERMLQAIRFSGDDCLVTHAYFFSGDRFPYDPRTGEVTAEVVNYLEPLGPSLLAGMVEPRVFGGSMIMIRRAVFEAIGGYREVRDAAHEDWELHARLAMAGYKTDVLPEYLHFYRVIDDGLARTAEDFSADRRMTDAYDRQLTSVGLHGAANAMHALYRQLQDAKRRLRRIDEMAPAIEAPSPKSEFFFFEAPPGGTDSAPQRIEPEHAQVLAPDGLNLAWRQTLLADLRERLSRLLRRDRGL